MELSQFDVEIAIVCGSLEELFIKWLHKGLIYIKEGQSKLD
jgi:hypothetical protein